jgi:dihydroxy-acid dehydratase
LEEAKDLPEGQDVIRPLDKPIKESGHIRCVRVSGLRTA